MGLYRPLGRSVTRNSQVSLHSATNSRLLTSYLGKLSTKESRFNRYGSTWRPSTTSNRNEPLALLSSWGIRRCSTPYNAINGHIAGICKKIQALKLRTCCYSCQSGSRVPVTSDPNDSVENTQTTVSVKQCSAELATSEGSVLGVNVTSEEVSSSCESPEQSAAECWSHTLHKAKDGKDITIHYCKTLEDTEKVAQLFLGDPVIGLDLEWKAQASARDTIQNNVSLIQLANHDRIALFQISLFSPGNTPEDLISSTLKQILENPKITKTGVAIKADCTRLRKYLGIETRSIFELSHLHKLVKYCHSNPTLINKRPVSLAEQVEEHLGSPMVKDDDVRCGNWAVPLSESQIHYAAADAYACYQLFQTMDAKRRALDPAPPLPAHADLNLPIRVISSSGALNAAVNGEIKPAKRVGRLKKSSRTV
ncbi:ribonuclease H-like domain-containing protein [Aspergillus karnatakaensis]|uniref:3'-5' exonuclease n=1 Tax=Aspergillus karnatakaensis TaxID=1810916 RepID=UPI003CCCCE09